MCLVFPKNLRTVPLHWDSCPRIGICCAFSFFRDSPACGFEPGKQLLHLQLRLRHSSRLWESSTCSNRLAVPLAIKVLTRVAMVVWFVWNVSQHSTTNDYISIHFTISPKKTIFRYLQDPEGLSTFIHTQCNSESSGWSASSDVPEAHEAVDRGSLVEVLFCNLKFWCLVFSLFFF